MGGELINYFHLGVQLLVKQYGTYPDFPLVVLWTLVWSANTGYCRNHLPSGLADQSICTAQEITKEVVLRGLSSGDFRLAVYPQRSLVKFG